MNTKLTDTVLRQTPADGKYHKVEVYAKKIYIDGRAVIIYDTHSVTVK
jgi:hypothetical protein